MGNLASLHGSRRIRRLFVRGLQWREHFSSLLRARRGASVPWSNLMASLPRVGCHRHGLQTRGFLGSAFPRRWCPQGSRWGEREAGGPVFPAPMFPSLARLPCPFCTSVSTPSSQVSTGVTSSGAGSCRWQGSWSPGLTRTLFPAGKLFGPAHLQPLWKCQLGHGCSQSHCQPRAPVINTAPWHLPHPPARPLFTSILKQISGRFPCGVFSIGPATRRVLERESARAPQRVSWSPLVTVRPPGDLSLQPSFL